MGELIRFACIGALACAAMVFSGCGSSEPQSGAAQGKISVQAPTAPTAAECAESALATDAKAEESPPPAGTYEYSTEGTRRVLGPDGFAKPLPETSSYTVTEAKTFGGLKCFVVQRKYTEALADTATFAIRGSDVYLTRLVAQNGGELIDITPNPPAISLSGSETQWEGQFKGPVSASYRGEILGRRTIRIGGRAERAVGIRTEFEFAGDLTGSELSTRWFSLDDNLPLMETVEQTRKFGLDDVQLKYTARLKSRND